MAAAKAKAKAKPKEPPDAAELAVQQSLKQAQAIWSSGLGTTLILLKDADANLAAKLQGIVAKNGGPTGKFTEASATLYRKQIGLVTEYLERRLAGDTHAKAMKQVASAVKATVTLAKTFEAKFTGITRPLALESQQMQDETIRGQGASLLQRHQSSFNRYGKAMVADFERVLRGAALEGLTHEQTVSRLVESGKLGGHTAASLRAKDPHAFPEPTSYVKRRYWAERIVRTEMAYARGASALQAMNITRNTEFPDLCKKILATFDNRTAPDSVAVHGQVRKLEEMFMDGAGRQYLHPPGRPNDRETVIPWRPHWEPTPSTQAVPASVAAEAEVAAAPAPVGATRKAELKGALEAAKAKVLAKKQQAEQAKLDAQAFALAQAKAKAAQAEGAQALGQAVLADEAALKAAAEKIPHVAVPGAKFSAAKAKAQEYLHQKAEIAKAKAAALAAERQAMVESRAKAKVEAWKEPDIFEGHQDVMATFKVLAKEQPKVFAEMYHQVTGKSAQAALGKLNKPLLVGAMSKEMGKKLQPGLAWPKPQPKKPPAPPPETLEQKLEQLMAAKADLAAIGAKLTPEEIKGVLGQIPTTLAGEAEEVATAGHMTPFGKASFVKEQLTSWKQSLAEAESYEIKEVPHAGKLYQDVHDKSGNKLGFFFKEGDELWVKPPLDILPEALPYKAPSQKEAAAYAVHISKQIQEAKAAKAATAAEEAKAKQLAAATKAKQLEAERKAARSKPWSPSWKAPERAVADVKTKPAKQLEALPKNRAGQSLALDEDYIENFDVSFTREKVGAREEVVVRFKVTEHRGEEVLERLEKAGGKRVDYGYRKLKGFDNPELQFDDRIEEKAIGVRPVGLEKGGVKVVLQQAVSRGGYSGELAAGHNVVELRFEAEPGADAMAKAKKGFDLLGIGTAQPKPETLEAYRRAKILAYADPDSARELKKLKERTPAAVQGVWEKSVVRNPKLKAIAEDAELREVSPGKHALYSKELGKQLEDAGVTWLKHTSGATPDVVEQVLATPDSGLLSSRERYQRGLFVSGMSTSRDFETGGADSVFLRLATTDPADLTQGYDRWTFQVDPSEMGRLDAYFFNSDNYGRAASDRRQTVAEIADTVRRGRLESDNEIMMQRQVSRSAIRRVVANTESDRTELLRRLRARGLEEINGVPLDEYVVLRQRY